jgi:rhodanese-related sulfurtransferase
MTCVGIRAAQKPPPAAPQLSPAEIDALLQTKENLFFLDVREPKELEESGSIKGYVNIPIGQLERRLGEIPKDKLIITA